MKELFMKHFRDASSYQSIDPICFNLEEYTETWLINNKKQLTIGGIVSSKRKSNTELFNKMNNEFMHAIIDSDNGIYDPIEEFRKELESKYIIIEK